jgi:hypothetical protein
VGTKDGATLLFEGDTSFGARVGNIIISRRKLMSPFMNNSYEDLGSFWQLKTTNFIGMAVPYASPFCYYDGFKKHDWCMLGTEDGLVNLFEAARETRNPTPSPTSVPSLSFHPTSAPSVSSDPTGLPSLLPSYSPTSAPTAVPTPLPSQSPTILPTATEFPAYLNLSYDFLNGTVGGRATPHCVDFDGDGDLDCLVGSASGYVYYYEGKSTTTHLKRMSSDFFSKDFGSDASPFCVDFDHDGDVDCIVGAADASGTASVYYMQNYGGLGASTDWYQLTDSLFFPQSLASSRASPFCADFDQDGDLDCLVGLASGLVHYFENTGSKKAWKFESVTGNYFGGSGVIKNAKPFCYDGLSEDGDLDCLVGGGEGRVWLYRNDGTSSAPVWVNATNHYFGTHIDEASPFCGDFTGDGTVECLVGNARGYVELLAASTPAPSVSPVPSQSPTMPSPMPTLVPTALPTSSPSREPTMLPSAPSGTPTPVPTTPRPSIWPTHSFPTPVPSLPPTPSPTLLGPTAKPTADKPSVVPTRSPTAPPTSTMAPFPVPTKSHPPTGKPSSVPTTEACSTTFALAAGALPQSQFDAGKVVSEGLPGVCEDSVFDKLRKVARS